MFRNIQILIFCLVVLIIYLYSNNIEYFQDTEDTDDTNLIPAIIFMRHGKEIDVKPTTDPKNIEPKRTYNFNTGNITLEHRQQTLDPYPKTVPEPLTTEVGKSRDYGIKDAKTLYKRLNDKIKNKYRPIDTIITIDPTPKTPNNPTANPFLTAYYYVYGESGDTPPLKNISDVKIFKLFDSKEKDSGPDGSNNYVISPDYIETYQSSRGKYANSILIIGTRDTLWGPKDQSKITKDRLLDKYKDYYDLKLKYTSTPGENNVFEPLKGRTAFIISGQEGNGTFTSIDLPVI